MTETVFYTTNTIVIVCSLLAGWGIFFHGRQFENDLSLLRRYIAAAFTCLALHRISLFSIIWDEGVEVYASQPFILLGITFIILAMGGTALMGRKYHLNFALWVLLLLFPVVFLMVNAIMTTSGLYNPLFTRSELFEFRANTPSIYYGRMFFVAFLFIFWLLTLCMLIEAYVHDRNGRATRPKSEDEECHVLEVRFLAVWTVLLILGLVPLCISSLWPHVLFNLLLLTALLLTALGYHRVVRYISDRESGRLVPVIIARRVPLLLNMKDGDTTAWGTTLVQNPFFMGNPTLEDVAQALGFTSTDISAYLQSLDTNLVAWVSDQRLRHSAELIAETDRKILEIAISCGYSDLSTFSRAFKRQFGLSPTEYRKVKSEE